MRLELRLFVVFFQAEDGIRDADVTGVQTCALPIYAVCTDIETHEIVGREAQLAADFVVFGGRAEELQIHTVFDDVKFLPRNAAGSELFDERIRDGNDARRLRIQKHLQLLEGANRRVTGGESADLDDRAGP